MTDEQLERLVTALAAHGDQLGGNLVLLKKFLAAQEEEQRKFLAEQREASDRAQAKANWTAIFAAIAAGAAAVAAIAQATVAVVDWRSKASGDQSRVQLTALPAPTAPPAAR